MCAEHRELLRLHFTARPGRGSATRQIPVGEKIDMAEIARLQAAERTANVRITKRVRLAPQQSSTDPATAADLGCVYYITWRRDAEYVKIGTTRQAGLRFKQLTTPHGDRPRLLVAEPGGFDQEQRRHSEFAAIRKPGTELFRYTQEIVDHIDVLRKRYPAYRDLTDVGRSFD